MPGTKIIKVPPDGGWGYMICAGFTISMVLGAFLTTCFGILYVDFLNEHNDNGKIVSWKIGINGVIMASTGMIVSVGSKYTSFRKISFIGSILYILVWTINIFITEPWHLLITHGIIEGFGFGMIKQVNYIMFNAYFVEKRLMLLSIAWLIVSISSIGSPLLVEYCMSVYGFRGTLLLITGISTHTLIVAALLQPVKWHLVPKVVEDNEEHEPENERKNDSNNETEISTALFPPSEENFETNSPIISRNDPSENRVEPSQENQEVAWKTLLKKRKLLRNLKFFNMCIGMGSGIVGDNYFTIMLPLLLIENNLTLKQAAVCMSILSFADLISKLVLSVIGKFCKIRSFHCYYLTLISMFIIRLVFLQVSGFTTICIMIAILGFIRAWLYILYPLLIAEEMPEENYADTFGLALLVEIPISIFYSVSTGLSNTFTGSYITSYYILTFTTLITITLWIIQIFRSKNEN